MNISRFRPRFTVRRLMVAVAIVALIMGAGVWGVEMRKRSHLYQQRAIEFGDKTARVGKLRVTPDGRLINVYDDENDRRDYAWACKLAEKYWRLSDSPWLSVEPDPPPPEPLDHPRWAIDLPAEMQCQCRIRKSISPWWTFPWTWRN